MCVHACVSLNMCVKGLGIRKKEHKWWSHSWEFHSHVTMCVCVCVVSLPTQCLFVSQHGIRSADDWAWRDSVEALNMRTVNNLGLSMWIAKHVFMHGYITGGRRVGMGPRGGMWTNKQYVRRHANMYVFWKLGGIQSKVLVFREKVFLSSLISEQIHAQTNHHRDKTAVCKRAVTLLRPISVHVSTALDN